MATYFVSAHIFSTYFSNNCLTARILEKNNINDSAEKSPPKIHGIVVISPHYSH